MTTTKTCGTCEHFPNDHHCVGCVWDEDKGENTKWELKKNPIVIERAVLDKIRAEIKTKYESIPWRNNDYDDGWIEALEWVFDDVLDKYKAESEEL